MCVYVHMRAQQSAPSLQPHTAQGGGVVEWWSGEDDPDRDQGDTHGQDQQSSPNDRVESHVNHVFWQCVHQNILRIPASMSRSAIHEIAGRVLAGLPPRSWWKHWRLSLHRLMVRAPLGSGLGSDRGNRTGRRRARADQDRAPGRVGL